MSYGTEVDCWAAVILYIWQVYRVLLDENKMAFRSGLEYSKQYWTGPNWTKTV